MAGALVLLLALGFFALRPASILAMNGSALQSSVGGSWETGPCRRLDRETWGCVKWDGQLSGTVAYRVRVHGLGCWSATRVGPPGEGSGKHLSGCVTILDYVL